MSHLWQLHCLHSRQNLIGPFDSFPLALSLKPYQLIHTSTVFLHCSAVLCSRAMNEVVKALHAIQFLIITRPFFTQLSHRKDGSTDINRERRKSVLALSLRISEVTTV